MQTTIICPNCNTPVEVAEVLASQIRKDVVLDVEEKHKHDLEQEKKRIEAAITQKFEEKNALEMMDLKKQLEERDLKVKEMRAQELHLREEKRRLEEKEKDMELEVARKLDQAKKQIEETVVKQTQDVYRLKDLEKEKVINDLRKALEDAQRKASQGSQQTQGEVAELDLEHTLQMTFTDDMISPVEKGVRGADIRQIVKTKIGNTCGVILWESKRTKDWKREWISKLKEDLRSEKANIPVIASSILPDEAKDGFGFIDGVYVVSHAMALPVATLLRQKLIEVAREKFIVQNRENTAEKLYSYVTSYEFRQQIEAIVEVYKDMQSQILKERVSFEKIWKTREAQVTKLFTSTAGIVGTMQGVAGQSFPGIKGLELLAEGEETSDQGSLL